MDISDLNLSTRPLTCLLRARINTVEELSTKTDSELLNIRNFGMGCLAEVRNALKSAGMEKHMTNADRIRAMSDEHLANYLMQFTDLDCRIGFCKELPKCDALLDTEDGVPLAMCERCLLDWLQQPAEEVR